MTIDYKRFNEQAWLDFGKNLLRQKRSEEQKEFLKACRSGKDNFLEYIHEHLISSENSVIDGKLIAFKYKFTEREFLYPQKDTQQIIWNVFKDVPEERLHYCGFWAYTITNLIVGGYIRPEYLASNLNGVHETGIYVIDKALKSDNEKTIDGCTRRILRSMCNPGPRGKRVVFDDCYLGKAYWRWHWSQKMSKSIGLDFKQILEILKEDYYAMFAAKMHTKKSYISSENVLGGLLLYLKEVTNKKLAGKTLRKIIDKISYLSAWKAIEIQEPTLNQKEIQQISKSIEKLPESEDDA